MPLIKIRLKKPCKDCEEMFTPEGKYCIYCEKCRRRRRKGSNWGRYCNY